jgi:hypothetical protein
MRRLRFAASLVSGMEMEFGPAAAARRRHHFEHGASDPMLGAHGLAVMAGPEAAPAEIFTEEHRARVLGPVEA